MIFESIRTVRADESRLQLWRQSRWCFLSRQRLSFRLRFRSQQGICVPTNPSISYGVSLVDYFWVVSYLVFTCDFRVNKDFVHWRIHASVVEAVSLMVSESAATQLSVMISKSKRIVCADESRLQLWRQSCWCFLSGQRLSFRLWFSSQLGLCALTNPWVKYGGSLGDYLWVVSYSVFGDDTESTGAVCADETKSQLGK
jgi:hypothetical protein